MADLPAAYADAQRRMSDIARACTPEQLTARVPACPAWSVKELIAHVTSIASDLSAGRLPPDLNLIAFWDDDISRQREEWIANALAARAGHSLEDVLAEWDAATTTLLTMLNGDTPMPEGAPPFVEWIVVTDIGQHLQDLHGALGTDDDRDALATGLSLRSYVQAMRLRVAAENLPTLRMRAGNREWVIGEGEPAATVTGDPFELSRAAAGRRNPDQIRAFEWDGDPDPFMTLFYPYGMRVEELVE